MAHAINSPSGASGWLRCRDWASNPVSSVSADHGTAAHDLAARVLTEGGDVAPYKGERIAVNNQTFEVDDEMVEAVQRYVDYVRALGGTLLVEQRLPLTPITGEADAFGTSDAVVIVDDELCIVDLKYGANPNNKVYASERDGDIERPNPQLGIYASAAVHEYEMLYEFRRVRMVIVQPRLDHISEFDMSVEDLLAWSQTAKRADVVTPGEKQCRWCVNKPTCPTLAKFVTDSVGAELDEITSPSCTVEPSELPDEKLSAKMAACDLIEDWCKAVRAEVERRLLAGTDVPGYKLVEGRKGARTWTDETEAEQALKSMRLKTEVMYKFKLISPTDAEKLAKAETIGTRQWSKLQGLITQSEGRPSVAPASDKRPALVVTPTADEFEDLTAGGMV